MKLQNPFRDPEQKPTWAHLTRLGGDRVAVLFEELRERISRIEGLEEDLHYDHDWGWAPRYSAGGDTLFAVHITAGKLAAEIGLESHIHSKLLASPRLAKRVKEALRAAVKRDGAPTAHFELMNRPQVKSFAKLVFEKARSIAAGAKRPLEARGQNGIPEVTSRK